MDLTYKIRRSFNLENNILFKIIKNDVKGIANKLKRLDRNLYLVYNGLHQCYELHDVSQRDTTYATTFDELDNRILDTVRKIKGRNTIKEVREQRYFKHRYIEQKKSDIEKNRLNLVLSEDEIIRV